MLSPSTAHPRHLGRSLSLALIAILLLRTAAGAMTLMVALYLKALGVSGTMVGLFSAVFYAMELFFSPAFGAWSDRYGRKPFMLLGPIFGGVAVLITSVTAHIPTLLFTRMLEGLSAASSIPSTLSYISDASDHSAKVRGRVVSLFELVTIGGVAIGQIVGGVLWDHFGRIGFAIDAVVYGMSLAVFVFGVEAVRALGQDHHTHYNIRQYATLLSDRHLLSFAPAWVAVNAIVGSWTNILPFLMSGGVRSADQNLVGGFSGTAIGLIFTLLIVVFGGGILLWGFFFSHLNRVRVMLYAALGLFVTAAAGWGLNNAPLEDVSLMALLLVALNIGILVQSGFTPAALGYLADLSARYPRNRGMIMGLYSVLFAVGQSLGAMLGGRFGDLAGVDGISLLTVILGVVTLVCILILGRLPDDSRPQPSSSSSA